MCGNQHCPSCGAPWSLEDSSEWVQVTLEDGTTEWWVACSCCRAPSSARMVGRINADGKIDHPHPEN